MTRRIAALVPNVLSASPGQRARIELWAHHLGAAGWDVVFHPFEDDRLHDVLYTPGRTAAKGARLLSCYGRHLAAVARGIDGDVIFVYREAALVGPALVERAVARRRAPLVYDLDDPIWVPYRSPTSGWMSMLKFPGKTRTLFRLSDQVIAINRAIGDYAARFNRAVAVIPNCIDTERYRPRHPPPEPPVRLAWIGSHSTVANLETIAAPLRALHAARPVVLRVIGAGSAPALSGLPVEFKEWSQDTEVDLLGECHVGLVPLNDLPWNPWKFFFKTIQYMALGLPVVARRMGSNPEVIDEGVNGYLVETEEEWLDRLLLLASDAGLRRRLGDAARATVVERYSVQSQMPRVVSVFEKALGQGRAVPAPGEVR
ncbi:MAG TPA: glycosyltransferase family 4 protein [Acidimicrobiales bacterium]|nr:glycosyltransferase family 4 protein [Acidimicrobiales bacterium]